MIPKSTFSFKIKNGIVSIVDLDEGGMSVINDIENVVEFICTTKKIVATEYKWIYQDSDGIWDGWDPAVNTFIHLQTHLESDAREQIMYKS